MAIRYDQKLLSYLRKTVKNYQAKRKKSIAKGLVDIPEAAYVSKFLNTYTNRRALLRDLKKLERYSERGAEDIVTLESGQQISQYHLKELKRLVTVAKRNITRQKNKLPGYQTFQPSQIARYEWLQQRYDYLKRPLFKLNKREFKVYERIAHGEGDVDKKERIFRENVTGMIDEVSFGVPTAIVDNLKKAINSLSIKKLVDLMENDPYVSSIYAWYDATKGGAEVVDLSEAMIQVTGYINDL